MMLKETLNSPTVQGIKRMARRTIIFILLAEGISAIFLAARWWFDYGIRAIWLGIFHSIAAFNNAGFDILATGNYESMAKYATDPIINITLAFTIIVGGLGFYVISDIYRMIRQRKRKLAYQTRVVLTATILLLIGGMVAIFMLEYNNPKTLGGYDLKDKILISLFNSVAPRTAGFSTINMTGFTPLAMTFIMILMFIGASPGGTGGGVKTTTAAALYGYVRSCAIGSKQIRLLMHRISVSIVNRAIAITALSLLLIATVSALLVEFDNRTMMQAIFETISAFGTVGLTTGITPLLGTFAKYLIMFTMFAGKIGVFTMLMIFIQGENNAEPVFPEGELST
jgi:trk system potassium uptake protein